MSIDYNALALQKGQTRKQLKAKAKRAEARQIRAVRAHCEIRDGFCRFDMCVPFECEGVTELAHMHARRRSKTRGMAPEYRHAITHCLCLCSEHHRAYDAKELRITALTPKGAEGELKFSRRVSRRRPREERQ